VKNSGPDFDWKKLEKGNRLGPFDAIFTCSSSELEIKSEVRFGPSWVQWVKKDKHYTTRIREETFLVIEPTDTKGAQAQQTRAEILNIKGEAFIRESTSSRSNIFQNLQVFPERKWSPDSGEHNLR
jgi:hypothetical protein